MHAAKVTATDPGSEPDEKIKLAEDTADHARLATDPIGMFLQMEGIIRDWYKHIKHAKPPDNLDILKAALRVSGEDAEVRIPRSILDDVRVKYDLEIQYRIDEGYGTLDRQTVDAVVQVMDAEKIKATTNDRNSGIRNKFARYRRVVSSGEHQYSVVELPNGKLTTDPM